MPRESLDTQRETKAPKGNHLAILKQNGTAEAIPEGALLVMVDEAVGHPILFSLQKVSTSRIVLGLVDQSGRVGTEYTYKVSAGKPLNRDAYLRMKKEGKVR